MIDSKQFVFVIGAPRSGTTWLHQMIAQHPSIASHEHELTLLSNYIGNWDVMWRMEADPIKENRWINGLPTLIDEQEFKAINSDIIQRIYQKVADKNPNAEYVIDKHPGYTLYLETIEKYLPEAKFIHIVRDGRNVAVSMMNSEKKIGFGGWNEVSAAAISWKKHVVNAERCKERVGDRFLELRYEDLFHNAESELKKTFDFLKLSIEDATVSKIASEHQFGAKKVSTPNEKISDNERQQHSGWKQQLSTHQKYYFLKHAGKQLKTITYENSDNWWYTNGLHKAVFKFGLVFRIGGKRIKEAVNVLMKGKPA